MISGGDYERYNCLKCVCNGSTLFKVGEKKVSSLRFDIYWCCVLLMFSIDIGVVIIR